MKVVKPITMDLSIMDTLVITTALLVYSESKEYNEIDREAARQLKARIDKTILDNAIEIERGD
jgi:hypothetical protein